MFELPPGKNIRSSRTEKAFRAPLLIDFRRLFAFGQIPIGKIFGGYLQVATLKSSCIVLFAHLLKIHPFELIEIPFIQFSYGMSISLEGAPPIPLFITMFIFSGMAMNTLLDGSFARAL